jgi:hypothetical protein
MGWFELLRHCEHADGEHDLDWSRQFGNSDRVNACADDRAEVVVNLDIATGDHPVDVQAVALARGATARGDLFPLQRQELGEPLVGCGPRRNGCNRLRRVVEDDDRRLHA